ncbi:unnamed protein product [Bursaphelenchus okinawaensis]|uniref:Uncharacterized protein n=1 Tax=Bursaphelenchus okinawaensis TaxID=465554 RepID=A0A811JVI4_9BILA|nr:unnamed protein product [Bursaphelenchus okinawaensis]CAG9085044.1 unnamed protein product [Bursaphelenchus okinawaensis]
MYPGGNRTSKHDVSVIFNVTVDYAKHTNFEYDAILGVKPGKDTAFDKLVSVYDKNDQYLLLVPAMINDDTSKAKAFLGEEPSNVCGEFNLVDSNSNVWTNDYVRKVHNVNITFKVTPSFDSHFIVSSKGISLLGDHLITKKQYRNLRKFNVSYGGVDLEINPQDAYKHITQYYGLDAFVHDDCGFDLGLPNHVFEKHCIKMAKDGKKYKIGLAERKQG